jgi:hypothetical protein
VIPDQAACIMPQPGTGAAVVAPALMQFMLGAVTPFLMTGGIADADVAARQTIMAYDPAGHDQLITVAQIVGFALASLDNLRLSAAADLSAAMKLRLRGNAAALNRVSQRNMGALEAQRHAIEDPTPALDGLARTEALASLEGARNDVESARIHFAEVQQTRARHAVNHYAEDPHAEDPHAEDPHAEDRHAEDRHTQDQHAGNQRAQDQHTQDPLAENQRAVNQHTQDQHTQDSQAANQRARIQRADDHQADERFADLRRAKPRHADRQPAGLDQPPFQRPQHGRSAIAPAKIAAATTQSGPTAEPQQSYKLSWANAMTDVAAECSRNLAKLAPADRRAEIIRIGALSETARHLARGETTSNKSELLASTSLAALRGHH